MPLIFTRIFFIFFFLPAKQEAVVRKEDRKEEMELPGLEACTSYLTMLKPCLNL